MMKLLTGTTVPAGCGATVVSCPLPIISASYLGLNCVIALQSIYP
ncbi:hypothetical protein ACVWYF_003627 [Hymenobacter sp. UYAg731]